jgi:hypothetical protein
MFRKSSLKIDRKPLQVQAFVRLDIYVSSTVLSYASS